MINLKSKIFFTDNLDFFKTNKYDVTICNTYLKPSDIKVKKVIKLSTNKTLQLKKEIKNINKSLLKTPLSQLSVDEFYLVQNLLWKYNSSTFLYFTKENLNYIDFNILSNKIILTDDNTKEKIDFELLEKLKPKHKKANRNINLGYNKVSFLATSLLLFFLILVVGFTSQKKDYYQEYAKNNLNNQTFYTSYANIDNDALCQVSQLKNYKIFTYVGNSYPVILEISDYVNVLNPATNSPELIHALDDTLYTSKRIYGNIIANGDPNRYFISDFKYYSLENKDLYPGNNILANEESYEHSSLNFVDSNYKNNVVSMNEATFKKFAKTLINTMYINLNGKPIKVVRTGSVELENISQIISDYKITCKDKNNNLCDFDSNNKAIVSLSEINNFEGKFIFDYNGSSLEYEISNYQFLDLYHIERLDELENVQSCLYLNTNMYDELFDYFNYYDTALENNIIGYRLNDTGDYKALLNNEKFKHLASIDDSLLIELERDNVNYVNQQNIILITAIILFSFVCLISILETIYYQKKYHYYLKYKMNLLGVLITRTSILMIVIAIGLSIKTLLSI